MASNFWGDLSSKPEPVLGGVPNINGVDTNSSSAMEMSIRNIVIVAGCVAVLAFLFLTVFVIYQARMKRKSRLVAKPSKSAATEVQSDEINNAAGTGPELSKPKNIFQPPEVSRTFTYEELKEATNEFSPSNLLGEGGFGRVYKGTIAGTLVAVKQLLIGGGQGEREFRAEVDIISKVHHRHLVSLVGYCVSDAHRLLVYNYVPNGTLQEALHGPGKPCMDWATRMNIALGTARGLAYLHEDCHPRIIHRDIKGSNIPLDNHWEAQVGDFGLAKLTDDAQSHVSTRVVGTFGYVAPEYFMSGRLTDKADVYSFGVVLLELITGKKPVDSTLVAADGEESLVEWARPRLTQALETGNVDVVADPNLNDKYEEAEMFRMVEVAATCVRSSSQKRPKMAEALCGLDVTNNVGLLHQGVLAGYSNKFASGDARKFHQMLGGSLTSQFSSARVGDSRSDGRIPSSASTVREHYAASPEIKSERIV